MSPSLPCVRHDLLASRVVDELIVFDHRTQKAHCLSPSAAKLWDLVDGTRTEADLQSIGLLPSASVSEALAQFSEAGLLQEPITPSGGRRTRRALLAAGAAFVSIVLPTAAMAASGTLPSSTQGDGQFDPAAPGADELPPDPGEETARELPPDAGTPREDDPTDPSDAPDEEDTPPPSIPDDGGTLPPSVPDNEGTLPPPSDVVREENLLPGKRSRKQARKARRTARKALKAARRAASGRKTASARGAR